MTERWRAFVWCVFSALTAFLNGCFLTDDVHRIFFGPVAAIGIDPIVVPVNGTRTDQLLTEISADDDDIFAVPGLTSGHELPTTVKDLSMRATDVPIPSVLLAPPATAGNASVVPTELCAVTSRATEVPSDDLPALFLRWDAVDLQGAGPAVMKVGARVPAQIHAIIDAEDGAKRSGSVPRAEEIHGDGLEISDALMSAEEDKRRSYVESAFRKHFDFFEQVHRMEQSAFVDLNHLPMIKDVTPTRTEVESFYTGGQTQDGKSANDEIGRINSHRNESDSSILRTRAWVSAPQRAATSMWVRNCTQDEPEQLTEHQAHRDRARSPLPPSSLRLNDVTEEVDMRDFGISLLYHPEAFLQQMHCMDYYSTVKLMSRFPSARSAACSMMQMTQFSEWLGHQIEAYERRVAHPEESESDGQEEESFKWHRMFKFPFDKKRFIPLNLLTGFAGIKSSRKYILDVVLGLRRNLVQSRSSQHNMDVPNEVIDAVMKSKEHQALIIALGSTLSNCQAFIPYENRTAFKLQQIPSKDRVPSSVAAYINKTEITIDIPIDMQVPIRIRIDGKDVESDPYRRRQRRLYFRSLLVVWELLYNMYRMPNVGGDEMWEKKLPDFFLRHYIPTYVGSVIWTENTPIHKADGSISSAGASTIERLGLKVVHERFPHGLRRELYVANVNPLRRPRRMFLYDALKRRLIDSQYLHLPSTGGERMKNANLQKIFDIRLPEASVDKCGRDATHHQTVSTPMFMRFDLVAETRNSHVVEVGDFPGEEFSGGDESTRDDRTSRIPVHRVHTLWVFRGTSQPKQWAINTMLRGIRDPTFSSRARVHSGFNFLFHQACRRPLTRFVDEMKMMLRRSETNIHPSNSESIHGVRIHQPYVIAFSGHSLGGTLATYSAWFVSKHLSSYVREGRIAIYCLSVGAPSIGDALAVEEVKRYGVIVHDIKMNVDPVPKLRVSRSRPFLTPDASAQVEIRHETFASVLIRSSLDGRLIFSGLLMLMDRFQATSPFERAVGIALKLLGMSRFMRMHLSLLRAHLHLYACSFTIMAGLFEEVGWSSMCSSAVLKRWPLAPIVASPEIEAELEKTHANILPKAVAKIDRKIADAHWLEEKIKLFEEEKFLERMPK